MNVWMKNECEGQISVSAKMGALSDKNSSLSAWTASGGSDHPGRLN